MDYLFAELKLDLEFGHEIHFKYKEMDYSISHSNNGWHLSKFYSDYQTFMSSEELLENAKVDGKSLNELWADVEVITVF